MTLLEKAMAEHSGIEESEMVRMICPEDLGYVNSSHLCQGRGYEEAGFDRCWKCWNQEVRYDGG